MFHLMIIINLLMKMKYESTFQIKIIRMLITIKPKYIFEFFENTYDLFLQCNLIFYNSILYMNFWMRLWCYRIYVNVSYRLFYHTNYFIYKSLYYPYGKYFMCAEQKKVCLNNGSYPSLLIFTQMGLNEKFSTYLNNHDGQKSVLISLSNSIVFKYLSCFSIIYLTKLCFLRYVQ